MAFCRAPSLQIQGRAISFFTDIGLLPLFFLACFTLQACSPKDANDPSLRDDDSKRLDVTVEKAESSTTKIARRISIEKKARQMFRAGHYDAAIDLYQKAMQPENLNYDYEVATSTAMVRKIYVLREKYDLALLELSRSKDKNQKEYSRLKEEIDLRAHYYNSDDSLPLLNLVARRFEEHKQFFPPYGYGGSGYSNILASEFIQLYDYVGAIDEGLEFVDLILAYPELNKNARAEFLKVKKAFEEDKASGTKGRATKVIIQSDYLPW